MKFSFLTGYTHTAPKMDPSCTLFPTLNFSLASHLLNGRWCILKKDLDL